MAGNWFHGARFKNRKVGLREGFRSGLEELNADHLKANRHQVTFEKVKIKYVVPATERTYTPDFELENGIIAETKGRFEAIDRAKMLFVKYQHPALDIRLVFQSPNAKLGKGSKTTYAMWADMHGFKWAKKLIPVEWMNEPPRDPAAPRGARTIAVPPEAKDQLADTARQPYARGNAQAARRAAVAGKKAGAP